MSKLKTKSSVKKRFKVTANGKILRSYGFKQHNMRKRSPKANRQARGTTVVASTEAKMLKALMPYA